MSRTRKPEAGGQSDLAAAPLSVKVIGAVFALIAILFLMGLVVAGVVGRSVPSDARPLVVFVFALAVAMASSFLGGAALAEGRVPILGAAHSPVRFSAVGGS